MVDYTTVIIAKGSSSLYRTILSVWKQDFPPETIILLSEEKHADAVLISLNTVIEDAGTRDIRVEIVSSEDIKINEIVGSLDTKFFHLLVERDFLLPEFGDRSSTFFHENDSRDTAIHTFWQRTKQGNSIAVSSYKELDRKSIPVSAFIFNTMRIKHDKWLNNFDENFEYNIEILIFDWIKGNNCVIQSNRVSAFAPKRNRR